MNNYDRRYNPPREYDYRPRSRPANTVRRKKHKPRMLGKVLYTVFFALFLLSLIGLLGGLGAILRKYLVGLFGLSAIGICVAAMLICVLRFFGFRLVRLQGRVAFFAIGTLSVFLLFLQVFTTVELYLTLESPTYISYLSLLFVEGAKTSGGLVFGLISYPFVNYVGARLSLVLLAIAFFALMFFAFLPLMLEDKRPEQKDRRVSKQRESAPKESQLELFVDTVDGRKSTNKVVKKSIFSSNDEDGFDIFNPNKEQSFDLEENEDTKDYREDILSENPDVRKSAIKNVLFHMSDEEASAVFSKVREKEQQQNNKPSEEEYIEKVKPVEQRKEDSDLPLLLGSRRIAQNKAHEILYGNPNKPQKQLLSEDINITRTITPEDASSIDYVDNSLDRTDKRQSTQKSIEDIMFDSKDNRKNVQTQDSDAGIRTDGKFELFGIKRKKTENKSTVPNLDDVLSKLEKNTKQEKEEESQSKREIVSKPKATAPKSKEERRTIIQAEQISIEEAVSKPDYVAPSELLLREYLPLNTNEDHEEIAENLTAALATYDINAQFVEHQKGPTFTQYAFRLADGVSIKRVAGLEADIKRKLRTSEEIRIIPAIEGMDAFGIELPNARRSPIGMRNLISSPEFKKDKKLQFALGVDVTGTPYYCDLLSMPHLLVAGSTGSGKSVCLNTIICSFLYHYSPEVVKFIMIDPKKVELNIYNGIPHMILKSTITDCGKAVNALSWAIAEMDRRYTLFQEMGSRNIHDYNDMQEAEGEAKLHYIVVIVDEMADLMTRARREVEDKIGLLASQARAAGIHLIVATQRPSVDVITGTIKNNIPTRIAFKVSSFADSKTIIDKGGAEKLFGKGDMLFMNAELSEPKRLQGPYMCDHEIRDIVRFVKNNNKTNYDEEANNTIFASVVAADSAAATEEDNASKDELFESAVQFVVESQVGSISMLQRKFKIGFNRAGRLIDAMSARGIVEQLEYGSGKSRKVLVTLEELDSILNENEDE